VLRAGLLSAAALAVGLGGCVRDPVDAVYPGVGPGDLVITEIRGEQTGGDTYGQWVEVYNATVGDLDLEGLHVVLTRVDGGATARVIVRRTLPVTAGGYVVLGETDDDGKTRPAHIDYGMGTDFTSAWYSAGTIELTANDVSIDAVQYMSLPSAGTWSLGVDPPDATTNDDPTRWCADTTPGTDTTQLGLPGTPGAANTPCPAI
jgi:hypothetical protein